jgi:hypothetical protein
MTANPSDFWTDDMSVIFTSFSGWSPETWGTLGWTGQQGLSRRNNLLKKLTDPFIAVIYVTESSGDAENRGNIVGFYLLSHETGHRNSFTHPIHHQDDVEQWEHSLRAIRAFTYVPEKSLKAIQFDPTLATRGLSVSKWAEILTDPNKIDQLRNIPWVESDVYIPSGQEIEGTEEFEPIYGLTRAGPANGNGYVVSSSAQRLERELYLLKLAGDTDAYLGRAAKGREIYKVGLSASPELRKEALQRAMPNGAFTWEVHRHTGKPGEVGSFSFNAAVAGEYAMKSYLAHKAEWLGGEFYLATQSDIEVAWQLGEEASKNF